MIAPTKKTSENKDMFQMFRWSTQNATKISYFSVQALQIFQLTIATANERIHLSLEIPHSNPPIIFPNQNTVWTTVAFQSSFFIQLFWFWEKITISQESRVHFMLKEDLRINTSLVIVRNPLIDILLDTLLLLLFSSWSSPGCELENNII